VLSRLNQQPVTRTASACARQLPMLRSQFRSYSTDNNASVAAPPSPSAPRQPTVGDLTTPSAISSATPGVSQPLSTPEGVHADINPHASTKPTAVRPPSSCPAGTKLNGLNYFKNKPEVFAKEDHEYPEWLWGLLGDASKEAKTKQGGVDPSSTLSQFSIVDHPLTLPQP
jgi:large subunit ribosomal protein L54